MGFAPTLLYVTAIRMWRVKRAARQKQDAELKKAREELREVLSLPQEAQLVLLGFLD